MANDDLTTSSVNETEIPFGLGGTWPLQVRNFIVRYLEVLFILMVAAIVVTVFYFLPYKIAFLNFFYLPVLGAAYFLGRRKAVMCAVLCLLSGVLFAYYRPAWFTVGGTRLDALLVLGTWGGFLILASAAIGTLQEKLQRGFEETRLLYEELKRSRGAEEMKEKVEKTLYATMDPVVAKLATEGKLRFEKREISIMFTDLTSFTAFSDKNRPDVVLEELNRFLGYIEPVLESFRGHIDKYMGDGVMVEFGAPVDYDQHALLAVLAGLKMQQKVQKLDLPWQLRVGIATGSAIVGMLGVRRQAYSALGDRVNVAKRLEEICEAGKIYIDMPIEPGGLERLRSMPGMQVRLVDPEEEQARPLPAEMISDINILFCTYPPENFSDMKCVELIQIASVGYIQLCHLGLPQKGVRACNARGIYDVPIAEWNVAMMVNLARNLRGMIRNQEAGIWDRSGVFQREIRGLTVGIWGYGGIGRETARLAKALGMVVHIMSRHGVGARVDTYRVEGTGDPEGVLPDRIFVSGQELEFLAHLDFLILAMPLTPSSEGIIGERELRALPPRAFILNPARGHLIKEQSLLKALCEGWITGAALDTHYYYPMPADHPLWSLPHVIMTPHISGSNLSPHTTERIWDVFLQNVERYLSGRTLLNQLSPAQLSEE